MNVRVRETTPQDAVEAEERRKAAIVRLPDCADERVRAIDRMVEDAQVLAASVKDRIDKFQRSAGAVDPKEITELQEALARHQARYQNGMQLLRSLRDFTLKCDSQGIRLEPYVRKGGRVKLIPPGTTPQKMIERHRQTIETLRQTIAGIAHLPIPFEDQRAIIERWVAELFEFGRPMLSIPNGELRLVFPAGGAMESNFANLGQRRMLALGLVLSGADRDTIVARLCELLPPTSTVKAMSKAEKEAKANDLRSQIIAAEREEEALIQRLADEGTFVLRRIEADPLAVLGVAVASRGAKAAA